MKGDDIMAGTIDTTGKVSNQIMSSTSKTSNTKKSNTLNMENFLSLLVAEMQNQDPLEPTSNSDYMAQMATFSQVEATSEMNGWQEIDGIVYLGINGNLYDINDVDQVIDKDYYEKWNNSGSTTGSSKTDTDNKTK